MGGLGLHTGAGYGERGAVSGLGRCPPTAPKSEWADPAPTEAPPGHAVPDRTRGFPNLPPLCPPVPPRLPNLALDGQGQHELERKAFQEGRVQAKNPQNPNKPQVAPVGTGLWTKCDLPFAWGQREGQDSVLPNRQDSDAATAPQMHPGEPGQWAAVRNSRLKPGRQHQALDPIGTPLVTGTGD